MMLNQLSGHPTAQSGWPGKLPIATSLAVVFPIAAACIPFSTEELDTLNNYPLNLPDPSPSHTHIHQHHLAHFLLIIPMRTSKGCFQKHQGQTKMNTCEKVKPWSGREESSEVNEVRNTWPHPLTWQMVDGNRLGRRWTPLPSSSRTPPLSIGLSWARTDSC